MKRLTLVLVAIAAVAAAQQQPGRFPARYADIALPSEAAGNGTLALRLLYANTPPLLESGAPIVVEVPGGFQAGGLNPALESGFAGFVYVRFLFPGGSDAGRASGGTYDTRGPQSILALRDVLLFCSGQKVDSLGRRIGDALPFPVLTDNVGLLGLSFGGNASTAVMGLHGDQLRGLKYFVGWENPTNAQIALGEPGPGATVSCAAGQRPERHEYVNPALRGYGPLNLDIDYSKLAVSSANGTLFFDHNHNGRIDAVTAGGCQTTDANGNGTIDADEDYPVNPLTALNDPQRYYSPAILRAAEALHLNLPSALANAGQAEAFWGQREAVRFYERVGLRMPEVEVMLLASVQDHVQTAPGHLHVRQAFDGFHRNGIWVKLNPSPASVIEVSANLRARQDLPRNEPNTAPADWTNDVYFYPEGIPDGAIYAAACREMARRAH